MNAQGETTKTVLAYSDFLRPHDKNPIQVPVSGNAAAHTTVQSPVQGWLSPRPGLQHNSRGKLTPAGAYRQSLSPGKTTVIQPPV